jgi:hypothetical protein
VTAVPADRVERTAVRLSLYVALLVGVAVTLELARAPRLTGRLMVVLVAGIAVAEGLGWLQRKVGARPGPTAPLVRRRAQPRVPPPVALEEWAGLMRSAGPGRRGAGLRARLRELTVGVLASRRGVHATRQPAAARAVLGPAAWILDDAEGGLDRAEVGEVLDALEAL